MYTFRQWNSFLYYYSANSTQSYLKKCYQSKSFQHAEQKSYENCYPFIYYLEHGQVYYNQAEKAPLMIQPILLFYGLVHLIKACILTVDPNYPETTSVLAHGVSTRKRKKQQYRFFEDEVKFQKSGLFPFMCQKLFHMKHLEGDKVTMRQLFIQIPELAQLFKEMEGLKAFALIKRANEILSFPMSILDDYHMTEDRFTDYLKSNSAVNIEFDDRNEYVLDFKFDLSKKREILPLRYCLEDEEFYFPSVKRELNKFPELLIHFLLLYNLSMIARYETEWWSELIKMKPNEDYPFIQSFLNITAKKGPFLIYQYLSGDR